MSGGRRYIVAWDVDPDDPNPHPLVAHLEAASPIEAVVLADREAADDGAPMYGCNYVIVEVPA